MKYYILLIIMLRVYCMYIFLVYVFMCNIKMVSCTWLIYIRILLKHQILSLLGL